MRLSLLTYNILDGGRGRESVLQDVIAAQNADVVVLQEVAEAQFVETLAAQLGYTAFVAASNSSRTIALLSRLPIQNAVSFHATVLRHTCVSATLEYAAGKTFTLVGVHLAAPAFTLWVEWYRLRELGLILEHIAQLNAAELVVTGDFNSIAPGDHPNFRDLPFSVRLSLWMHGEFLARQVIGKLRGQGFVDAFRMAHPHENGYTFPARKPNVRLDYFFVNERLRGAVRRCSVVGTPKGVQDASDHLPLRMELEL